VRRKQCQIRFSRINATLGKTRGAQGEKGEGEGSTGGAEFEKVQDGDL